MRKNKIQIDINPRDVYKEYYKKISTSPVESAMYMKILRDFYDRAIEIVVADKIFHLPEGFGTLSIKWRKPIVTLDEETFKVTTNTAPIDWKATNKWNLENPDDKRIIRHDNPHTNNRIARFHWSRQGCSITGLKPYAFHASRRMKRALTKEITK